MLRKIQVFIAHNKLTPLLQTYRQAFKPLKVGKHNSKSEAAAPDFQEHKDRDNLGLLTSSAGRRVTTGAKKMCYLSRDVLTMSAVAAIRC